MADLPGVNTGGYAASSTAPRLLEAEGVVGVAAAPGSQTVEDIGDSGFKGESGAASAGLDAPSDIKLDAEKRISFLERNLAAYEEEIKVLRERTQAAHVQVSTMWELLRRIHDMVLVFDLHVR